MYQIESSSFLPLFMYASEILSKASFLSRFGYRSARLRLRILPCQQYQFGPLSPDWHTLASPNPYPTVIVNCAIFAVALGSPTKHTIRVTSNNIIDIYGLRNLMNERMTQLLATIVLHVLNVVFLYIHVHVIWYL